MSSTPSRKNPRPALRFRETSASRIEQRHKEVKNYRPAKRGPRCPRQLPRFFSRPTPTGSDGYSEPKRKPEGRRWRAGRGEHFRRPRSFRPAEDSARCAGSPARGPVAEGLTALPNSGISRNYSRNSAVKPARSKSPPVVSTPPKTTLVHHDESDITSESITTFISEVPSKSSSFVTSVLHPASRAVAK